MPPQPIMTSLGFSFSRSARSRSARFKFTLFSGAIGHTEVDISTAGKRWTVLSLKVNLHFSFNCIMWYNCQCWPARLSPLAMNKMEEMRCQRACNFECVYNSNFRGLSISTNWKEQVKQLSLRQALKFIPVLSSWHWVNDGHTSRITRVIWAWWATWCTICCIFVPHALISSSRMTRNNREV